VVRRNQKLEWFGLTSSLTTQKFAEKFTKTDVGVEVVLEGIGCGTSKTCLPGAIRFTQVSVKDRTGASIDPGFSGVVNRIETGNFTMWRKEKFPDLNVIITDRPFSNGHDITLITGNA
jgi:hypothetical protein